ICTVCDILDSDEYASLIGRLRTNLTLLTAGLHQLNLIVLGGETPIITVLVGDEDVTLKAGQFLFEEGFYVQSVTFPAVPYHAGVLRIEVNANHLAMSIDRLVKAFAALKARYPLPTTPPHRPVREAA